MGKNKVNKGNPLKSGNPIYKKAGGGAAHKAKNKAKPVKTNLKKLKIGNREAIKALDKKVNDFREALQVKKGDTQKEVGSSVVSNQAQRMESD
ncbi:ribosomal biogenesis factor-like [Macrobrachium nipponense]|uniref:ribosomal biogenesis factor-like n=1 Tax=Macrobrachium nipponense TaxID=159736 RepID=UPI0030C7FB8D